VFEHLSERLFELQNEIEECHAMNDDVISQQDIAFVHQAFQNCKEAVEYIAGHAGCSLPLWVNNSGAN
jgi:hypothetical protein